MINKYIFLFIKRDDGSLSNNLHHLIFRLVGMDPEDELLDNYSFHREDQLIPKTEPIDLDFIKKEEIEEECYVEPGVTVSLKVDKVSVKEELCQNEEIGNSSSSNVRNCFILFYAKFNTL